MYINLEFILQTADFVKGGSYTQSHTYYYYGNQ